MPRRPALPLSLALALGFACACSDAPTGAPAPAGPEASADARAAAPSDGGADGATEDAGADAGGGCFVGTVGVYGTCMTTSACAALGAHVSTPGYCAGPQGVECCTRAPNVKDDPPVPAGWKLMQQSAVTADMTAWAVAILHDPVTYPMFQTAMRTFGAQLVMARVEWHPPDFQNGAVHRGVTLYQPV